MVRQDSDPIRTKRTLTSQRGRHSPKPTRSSADSPCTVSPRTGSGRRAHADSARRRSMRALTQSRCTVRRVTSRASAISSSSSRRRTDNRRRERGEARRSRAARSRRSIAAWPRADPRPEPPHCPASPAGVALPLLGQTGPCAIHEHVAHDDRCERDEVRTIAPRRTRLIRELQVGFVDEPRGVERVARFARGELAASDLA